MNRFNENGISLPAAIVLALLGLLASAVWNAVGPTLVGIFAALVQTGITTRLVLLGLFFGGGFGLYVLRTLNQVWYGYVACTVALAAAWNLIASLAVQMQSVDLLALVGAGYVLVRGLVNIQAGRERAVSGS